MSRPSVPVNAPQVPAARIEVRPIGRYRWESRVVLSNAWVRAEFRAWSRPRAVRKAERECERFKLSFARRNGLPPYEWSKS